MAETQPKPVLKSKGKLGALMVLVPAVGILGYGLVKGSLDTGSAMQLLMTLGVGLGIYGIRDKQDS